MEEKTRVRKLVTISALLGSLLFFSGCATSSEAPRFESSLTSAWRSFEEYDLGGAEAYFRDALSEATVLQVVKAQGEALSGLSLVLLLEGKPAWKKYFVSALRFVEKGGCDPFSISVLVLVAAEANHGSVAEVFPAIKKLVNRIPEGALKQLTMARYYRAKGDFVRAIAILASLEKKYGRSISDYMRESLYREKSKIYLAMCCEAGYLRGPGEELAEGREVNSTSLSLASDGGISYREKALESARKALRIASKMGSRYRVIDNLRILYKITGDEVYLEQLKWLGVNP